MARDTGALAVSERIAQAVLQAAHDQARDAVLLQSTVAQGVALLYSTILGDTEASHRAEEQLRRTVELVTRSRPDQSPP